jgi:hypothetical protein
MSGGFYGRNNGAGIKGMKMRCVLYGSENKQGLFPYTALTDQFLQQRRTVFTARYDGLPIREAERCNPQGHGSVFCTNVRSSAPGGD